MKEIIEESLRLLAQKQPHVVATVVRTKGMTPQKAGARQLIRQDGTSIGTLGGGCVEGDIWFYATEMLREKSGPQFRAYTLNADLAAQDGLVCGGTMYFFLEPHYQPEPEQAIAQKIAHACDGGDSIAVATVVNSAGALQPGAKWLVTEETQPSDLPLDHATAREICETGNHLAATGQNKLVRGADGSEIYLEGFTAPPTLVVLGGGHIGKAVYNLALPLGFRVIIIDDRAEFANAERFPAAHATVAAPFDEALRQLDVHYNCFILIATRGHKFDDLATRAAVNTAARYIGLLGSKRKNMLIFQELRKAGVPDERIRQIHAPVGLDIGAITPEEIAVSIVAEMIACLRGGEGRPLKLTHNVETQLVHENMEMQT